MSELVDNRRNLESLHENALLSLDADISGPLHEAGQVALRLEIVADSEVLRSPHEQRILALVASLGSRLSGSDYLLSLSQFLWLLEQ